MTPDILLGFGVLAVTGLVRPTEALAGFSNAAVVTISAVFILSGGLTQTGIANILGRYMNTFTNHLFGFLELRYTRYEKLSV